MKKLNYLLIFVVTIFLVTNCNDSTDEFTDGDTDSENITKEDGDTDQVSESGLLLTILHTNDTHSKILEFDGYGSTCEEEESAAGECFGGVARRKTAIDEVRASADNVLLLDAGDQFQGSLFFTYFQGEASAYFMNLMKYDAMAVGNHEFDSGSETLADFIDLVNFPVLACNIDAKDNDLLKDKILPYKIFEVDGKKVAVIGYISEETEFLSQGGSEVTFNEIESALSSTIKEIEQQNINIIIGLSHAGLARDESIAQNIPGLDIIVGGHSHSLLSNTDNSAVDGYPVVYTSSLNEPVIVVTASYNGKYLGRLNISFDKDGIINSYNGEPILLDSGIKQDEETLAKALEYDEELQPIYEEIIGSASVSLNGSSETCRFAECNFGNLIADALLKEGQSKETQMAMINSGAIRASIDPGEITLAEILQALPFGNSLSTFKLEGVYLREALEHSVSRAEDPENEGTGRFLQVSGIRFSWDKTKVVGQRVSEIEVKTNDDKWEPLDDDEIYNIAVPGFTRQGGDDYDMFSEHAKDAYDYGRRISDIVSDYIEQNSPVSPSTEGRINAL